MTPIANPAPSVPETVVVTPAPLTPAEVIAEYRRQAAGDREVRP